MKKLLCIISAVLLISLSALPALGDSYTPGEHCKTEGVIKHADPAKVIKDGKIGEGEYAEIEINRDPDTTDLMFSWEFGKAELYDNCCKLLENTHFYVSWDEKNGVNFAIKSTLCEDTPRNVCSYDSKFFKDHYATWGNETGFKLKCDEFLFQFGMSISLYHDTGELDYKGNPQYDEIVYRGFSKNTETGELMIGDYDLAGYAIRPKQFFTNYGYISYFEDSFNVGIDGNTVTYEISFPLNAVLPADAIVDGAPVEGTELLFNATSCGGSVGQWHYDDNGVSGGTEFYGVSIGDFGYMTHTNGADPRTPGKATFSLDPVSVDESGEEPPVDDPEDPPVADPDVPPVDDPEDPPAVEPGDKPSGDEPSGDKPTGDEPTGGSNAPQTGDKVMVIVIVAALSAVVLLLILKRKR